MIKKINLILGIITLIVSFKLDAKAQNSHPNLILTSEDVGRIIPQIDDFSLFSKSFTIAKDKIDNILELPIEVPVPMDAGGGYTHEKHKQNYDEMYTAGILYQFTKDDKYLFFIKNMLDKYAILYPTLGSHPQGKKQTPGRLFWQSLNETVWLLHTIQAYDCIYDALSESERAKYENNIFNPMVEFFINDCRHELDLIHNHGTWIVAAVGMAGFVLNNQSYVNKALYGYNEKGESGFLAQLNKLFSPDGYYTEGGYYARYALWPFFIFAESISNNLPDLKIYQYRNSILKKAFNSALQVTYTNGEFIPINDALKEKSWLTPELIFASNLTYANYEGDKKLLNLVKLHDRVSLNGAGFKVAKDFDKIIDFPPFEWQSVEYSDGPNGDQGGITILRSGSNNDQETLLLKYGSHGLSHGHFDKLSILFYDQGREILQDYGAARFLNIEQKFGGRYLPENSSYAKQSIAHNTIIVDKKSQFNGKMKQSQASHSEKFAVDYSNPNFQYASAKENNAYKGVEMHRTVCMLYDSSLIKPIIIDIYKVSSEDQHLYDLPYYYKGHLLSTNFDYKNYTETRSKLGPENGYQHLWVEAEGKPNGTSQITFLNGERFYTITSNTNENANVLFTRIGASDPDFNLRNEPGILIRNEGKYFCFATVIEPHGSFDPILEKTSGAYSNIEELNVVVDNDDFTVLSIKGKMDNNWLLFISNKDSDKNIKHRVEFNNKEFSWTGPVVVKKIKEKL